MVIAKVAVNAVLIGSTSGTGEKLMDRIGPAEGAEAQADSSESIGDPAFLFLLVLLIEVVARRHLIVEQGHVPAQGFVVEFLLVERPPQLVDSELVVGRLGAKVDDRRICVLGIAVFSAR